MKGKALLVALSTVVVMAACTKPVHRDPVSGDNSEGTDEQIAVPDKPGVITKVPETPVVTAGDQFTMSVNAVPGAVSYSWSVAPDQSAHLSIVSGGETNTATFEAGAEAAVIPAGSISVVAVNKAGVSDARKYLVDISVIGGETVGYKTKVYGTRTWMVENCREAGEDGNLGVTYDLTGSVSTGTSARSTTLEALNAVQGRYYTWYEAMTGISGATAEDCPYVYGYTGKDDAGVTFTLDGGEGEYAAQIRGCCPEGWHIANCNDWWALFLSIKGEYGVPDDFYECGYNYSYGHNKDASTAITQARFYSVQNATNIKQFGNPGAWLRGGNGREADGGVWVQADLEASDAGEKLKIFTNGAVSVGFNAYPLGYYDGNGGSFYADALGKYGFFWLIAPVDSDPEKADLARAWCVSGTSLNSLQLMNRRRNECYKTSRLNVRCVKNY